MAKYPPDDRDRGFLTAADRRYLHGESDIDPQSHSERRARERIRNRLLNALFDMTIIAESLEERDREQVFDKLFAAGEGGSMGMEALWAMASFAFEGVNLHQIPFEHLSNRALGDAIRRRVDDELVVKTESTHTIEIAQRSDLQPQMETIKESLDEGLEERDLNPGDKATLFDQLDRDNDIDPTAKAFESWDRYIENAKDEIDGLPEGDQEPVTDEE